jgi:hypothetical protein
MTILKNLPAVRKGSQLEVASGKTITINCNVKLAMAIFDGDELSRSLP